MRFGPVLAAIPVAALLAVALARPTPARSVEQAPAKGPAWFGVSRWFANQREVVLCGVLDDGPAGKAGLIADDTILAIAGKPMTSVEEFEAAVAAAPIGKPVEVEIERRGERHVVEVVAEPLPADGGTARIQAAAALRQGWALTEMGVRFAHMRGEWSYVEEDPAAAAEWFELAIQVRDNAAPLFLGILYLQGDGVEKDVNRAQKLFTEARLLKGKGVTKGVASAASGYLGAMCLTGLVGGRVNPDLAFRFYRDAANQGGVFAMRQVARMYEKGQGVPPDLSAAVQWYQKAAALGDSAAQEAIVRLDLAGVAIPRPTARSSTVKKSLSGGRPSAPPASPTMRPAPESGSRTEPTKRAPAPSAGIISRAGILDPDFGAAGVVRCDFGYGGLQDAYAVRVQADGKIVTVGEVEKGKGKNEYYLSVARFNADGSPDLTFNGTGRAAFTFGPHDDGCRGRNLALQPDGKIVAAGRASPSGEGYDWGLLRLDSRGALDASFGGGAVVTRITDMRSADVGAIALQPDGKIVAVGIVNTKATVANANAVGLARFHPSGQLDRSFGNEGKVVVNLPGDGEEIYNLAFRPDGKIVAAGWTRSDDGNRDIALLRFQHDGSPDYEFDRDGMLTLDLSGAADACAAMVLQGLKAVLSVSSGAGNYMLLRLNENGAIDSSFGAKGAAPLPFVASGLGLLPDGRIVAGGTWENDLAVAVLSADGTPDPSFGDKGIVRHKQASIRFVVRDMAVSRDGMILLCGQAIHSSGQYETFVARVLAR